MFGLIHPEESKAIIEVLYHYQNNKDMFGMRSKELADSVASYLGVSPQLIYASLKELLTLGYIVRIQKTKRNVTYHTTEKALDILAMNVELYKSLKKAIKSIGALDFTAYFLTQEIIRETGMFQEKEKGEKLEKLVKEKLKFEIDKIIRIENGISEIKNS